MGTDDAEGFLEDGEGPVREVELSPFAIDAHAVTNRRFADFIDATGYTTDAERYGWSFVFAGLLPDSFPIRAASSTHRGGARSSVPLGAVPRVRNPRSTTDRITPSYMSRGAMLGPSAPGRSCGFRPRPSGSSRHAEDWSGSAIRGAMSGSLGESTE